MMHVADGVTFISEFGLVTARAECPVLLDGRCHVVGCGVDVEPIVDAGASLPVPQPFVVCLSATFHHKNRVHAIRTFAAMCEQHAYPGSLVIAGPEPFYGRSDDSAVVESLPVDVRRRVVRLGHVDVATKWALLRHADLLLYPSIVEGFGLVPFEAASVGTPSLSFDGTGLAEVLAAPAALVGSWDPDAWAARASELVAAGVARDGNVASVQAVARNHAWADVAGRTWDAIDATIAQVRQTPLDEGSRWALVNHGGRDAAEASAARHLVLRVVAALRRRLS
jgi:glycosyltransferase involved in cell wall biosynthesis